MAGPASIRNVASMLKNPLRIGNISGATGDAAHALDRMVKYGNVDVVTGDWLSEMNIAWNAIIKKENPGLGYEDGFYQQLEGSLDEIFSRNIRVITNAGALNTLALAHKVQKLCQSYGHDENVVAVVLGDDLSHLIKEDKVAGLPHLDHETTILGSWGLEPFVGSAYIGCRGIVTALEEGARIVICGRCTDASPVMGAAAWHFGWKPDQYDEMAGSLLAGHLIECGAYVVGANFSGFKEFLPDLVDLAFPIAEIAADGSCIITKTTTGGGHVTTSTVIAQLLYELQGHLYLNPDVVADLSGVFVEPEKGSENRVRVYGAKGLPPPPTTKVMFAAPGGFQAEVSFFLNGLDITAKLSMMKQQLEHAFRNHKFSKFSVEAYGSQVDNAASQQSGTVQLRVFAQARNRADIEEDKFKRPIYALRMQSYPGYHMNLDFRTMAPKPFMEIFPALIPNSCIKQQVMLASGRVIEVRPHTLTKDHPFERPSYETESPRDLKSFGPTQFAPLGSIVHARSGDKGDNSNIGFFVRNKDEYPWLQSILTVERLKELFGDDWHKANPARRVERVEFKNILAVHFRVFDNLNGGIASSDRIDGLGKGVGEYPRSRWVEVPIQYLERGWI